MPMMMGNPSDTMTANGVAAIVSSLSLSSIGFFEIVWVIGMTAMMFPAMIPMVLFYNKVKTKLESSPILAKVLGTPIFLSGYLVTYALLGVGAYLIVYEALALPSIIPSLSNLAIIAPSAILIAVGSISSHPLRQDVCLNVSHPSASLPFIQARGFSGASGWASATEHSVSGAAGI